MTVMTLNEVSKNFGGLAAVSNVSLEIGEGQLVGLIGPNGAGKTTLFNLITGIYKPTQGEISVNVDGKMKVINGLRPDLINGYGIARTFQNIRLFTDMTVLENVLIAMHRQEGNSVVSSFLRTHQYYQTEEYMKEQAMSLLKIFNLQGHAYDKAKNLAYGQQRRLEIVRAMATRPKILFLDEPAAGMNPFETRDLTELIIQIQKDYNLTVILIEHDMSLVMEICEKIYVLEYGRLIAEGTAEEIQKNEKVIQAYLGGDV